jgi:hypothetical protein
MQATAYIHLGTSVGIRVQKKVKKKFKTQVKVGFLNKKSKLPFSLISDLTFGRKDQTELY